MSSAAVVIGALRVNIRKKELQERKKYASGGAGVNSTGDIFFILLKNC